MLRPLVTALPQAQLYETDVEPTAVFRAALAEVFRIPVAEEKLGKVQVAWKGYVKAIGVGGIVSFCGTSLNLEEQLFAGAIGYETKEVSCSLLITWETKLGQTSATSYPYCKIEKALARSKG